VDDRKESRRIRGIALGLLIFIVTAIVLSYTRAAWVALTAAFGCYLIFLLRIKSWVVYSGIALVVITYLFFRIDIQMYLERNDQTSSTDYAAHIQSIGNISTDDSNIERLNRWACALRMFAQKPILGYGPGTYMFQYGQFQKYSERSGISTNFAEGGGSHSEYLGPLSEQGVMGPITFILIGAAVIIRTSKFLKRCNDRSVRGLTKGLLLGLITYWIHGILNYFLDTEKAAVPFWGFIAALVAIEIYHEQKVVINLNDRTATE
jgi:O-antigen ligase